MLKGDLKKIVINTGWMVFDKVFIMSLNLLVTFKIANHFGLTEFGNFQYAVSVVALLEILVTFIDGRSVKKRYQDMDPTLVVFNTSICRLGLSLISAFIGVILIIFGDFGFQYSVLFAVLLLNILVSNLRFGLVNRFEYMLKSKKTVIASDVAALLSSFLQFVAVDQDASIVSLSVITLISSFVNLTIVYVQYKIEFPGKGQRRLDFVFIKSIFFESFPLAIAASSAIIYTKIDSVMLESMLSAAEVGVYAISLKFISVVQIALGPVRESVFPKMNELFLLDKKKYEKRYIQITCLMTWVYFLGVVFSFLLLPYAFNFLKAEYSKAFPVYQIYVIGTFFMYNAILRASHYTIINKGSVLMISQIVSVALNIILNYVGIRLFGLFGAALAAVITQGFSLLISNLFFGKEGRQVFVWQIKGLNPLYLIKR